MESKDAAMDIGDVDDEYTIIKMSGIIPRRANNTLLLPSKSSIQDKLFIHPTKANPNPVVVYVNVKEIWSEKNFRFLHIDPTNPCHTSSDEPIYFKVETAEQADYVIAWFGKERQYEFDTEDGTKRFEVKFTRPDKNKKVRRAYTEIGPRIKRLNDIHIDLQRIGAVPGYGGIPQLPDTFVDPEVFDKQVRIYESLIANEKYSRFRGDLHHYLVNFTRIDRSVLQPQVDSLVDEKMLILLELSRYNQHVVPFKCIREYNPSFKKE